MHAESRPNTPMVCFLSMGSDPTPSIHQLAKKIEVSCRSISMGQGQEVHARRLLQSAKTEVSFFFHILDFESTFTEKSTLMKIISLIKKSNVISNWFTWYSYEKI